MTTSKGDLGVEIAGEGSATPILFLHGVGSDRSAWAPQLAHYGATRRAIALDWPGYGDSAARPADGPDDFATAAFDALDALGIARAHICGLSLGGVVALAMGHLAPGRCASLTIADSFAFHPDGAAIHRRSVAASGSMAMGELAAARAPLLLGRSAPATLHSEVIATMSRIDPRSYRAASKVVWLADQRERAESLHVPTLILVGDEDHITPPSLSAELEELIPGAVGTVIAWAGHLSNLEQPAAFNAALDQFLARVEANA